MAGFKTFWWGFKVMLTHGEACLVTEPEVVVIAETLAGWFGGAIGDLVALAVSIEKINIRTLNENSSGHGVRLKFVWAGPAYVGCERRKGGRGPSGCPGPPPSIEDEVSSNDTVSAALAAAWTSGRIVRRSPLITISRADSENLEEGLDLSPAKIGQLIVRGAGVNARLQYQPKPGLDPTIANLLKKSVRRANQLITRQQMRVVRGRTRPLYKSHLKTKGIVTRSGKRIPPKDRWV